MRDAILEREWDLIRKVGQRGELSRDRRFADKIERIVRAQTLTA